MKRSIVLLIIVFTAIKANGQGFDNFKLGFKFSPSISSNRVMSDMEGFDFDSDGSALKLTFGPIVDIPLSDQYFLTSGILFASKAANISQVSESSGAVIKEEYNLQYLQVPVALKLYTNEIEPDIRIYFNFGTELELKLSDKTDSPGVLVNKFRAFDVSLFLGTGAEYQLSSHTALFAGFSYHRGLINAIRDGQDFSSKNDLFSLDLGIKF